MKILLIGNYLPDQHYSMQHFLELLRKGISNAGHQVRILRPPAVVGRIWPRVNAFGKWLGYVDKFILFPLHLKRSMLWPDIVHICDQANAVYLPYIKTKPHVVTCHDMIAIRSAIGEIPESTVSITGRIYQRWILRNLGKAQRVVCAWTHTKEHLKTIANVPANHISVVLHGQNYPYHPMSDNESIRYLKSLGLIHTRPFLLHVGGNQWYKNRDGVLQIFSHLLKIQGYENYMLVMAGHRLSSKMKRIIDNLKIAPHVIELVDLKSIELCALYTTAKALLFPSLVEGFGWPIIEAQACGCPVFTSNRVPMNEVGGDAAVYFDPDDELSAAVMIAENLKNNDSIITEGLINSSRFSVKGMIDRYLSVYNSAINHYGR